MDKEKKPSRHAGASSDSSGGSDAEELYRKLQPEMRRPKPSPEAIAAAMEAAQRLAAEADAEEAVEDLSGAETGGGESSGTVCAVCGYRNRSGNKFCGKCGALQDTTAGAVSEQRRPRPIALHPNPFLDPEPEPMPEPEHEAQGRVYRPAPNGPRTETHHYHHHYHYFTGGGEGTMPRPAADGSRPDPMRDFRPSAAAMRGDMSRAEAAVRRITQEWVLASNTKHLDDLLDLYVADPMVLRSNYPPVRGAAAVREFFYTALDAGLGEVEMEPLRIDIASDMAYEAGRCKALVPGATGKRREERGKYLWVCTRTPNGDWKLAVDCWSSDLSLTTLESDAPSGGVKSSQPRRNS